MVSAADELLAEVVRVMQDHLDVAHPWRLDALCREPAYETETFYTARGASTAAPRAVCARCPVTFECAEYAVTVGTKHGIWGGLSERERRKVRSAEREAA